MSTSPTVPLTLWGIDISGMAAFDAAWKASKDPRILAIYTFDSASRFAAAEALALKNLVPAMGAGAQSVLIDVEIDALGADAFLTMNQRLVDGLTWVPSGFMPNIQPSPLEPSEAANPPFVPYDPLHPPPGAIMVTINPQDPSLIPYPTPAPTPAPTPTNPAIPVPKTGDILVGPQIAPGVFGLTTLAMQSDLPDGFTWTQGGVTYILHVVSAGMAKIFEVV